MPGGLPLWELWRRSSDGDPGSPLWGNFFAGGIGAFAMGLVAVLRRGKRSLAVMIAVIIGMLVGLFLVGEFAFPH